MAIIDVGDLLINNSTGNMYIATSSDWLADDDGVFSNNSTGNMYIATSCDFTCRVAGTGEFIDDWSFVPAVSVINPKTGSKCNVYLRDVKKLTGT